MSGDCFFSPDLQFVLPHNGETNLADLQANLEKYMDYWHGTELDKDERDEMLEDYRENLKGAWIIDEKGKLALEALWDNFSGSDSALYSTQKMAKAICARMALSNITGQA